MIGNIFKVLISVKAKLFFGFLSMSVIISLLGGYAYLSLRNASYVVEDTFDRPLFAVNYARSAAQIFTQLELELLRHGDNADEEVAEEISDLIILFKEDLEIAKERSISDRATSFFTEIENDMSLWERSRLDATTDPKTLEEIATRIEDNLDIIVELQNNQSYRNRESSLQKMARFETYSLAAITIALALTLALSIWIALTIIKPLKAAAMAARKISAGNFDVDIPKGGDDETGVLLKTMSVMQRSIRKNMGREQNLRTLAQNRLADSLRNSQDAILLTDKNGKIIVANPKIDEMFPLLKGHDLLEKKYSDYFTYAGVPLHACENIQNDDHGIKFDDGRWARVSASDTQEGGRLYIWSDTTEAKNYTENLLKAKEAAEAADKAKTTFLAVMSHELRTPLNGVIGFSDIISSDIKKNGGNDNHADMARLIAQSGKQLLNIVTDILTISDDKEWEDSHQKFEVVNMKDIVVASLQDIDAEAKSKKIRLIWDVSNIEYSVMGDAEKLKQMVFNLLSNAVKFNRDNGVVKIQIIPTLDQRLQLDVIDNGIGMNKEKVNEMMLPFTQMDAGHSRRYEGLGLGLSIVKKIVQAHKGEIRMRSDIETGTVATILLPRVAATMIAQERVSA